MDKKFSHDNETQFVFSHELLCLLRWLMEHDSNKIKRIIISAVKSKELFEDIQKRDNISDPAQLENMQHSIIDFFGLLESLLLDAMAEQVKKKAQQKNLMPAVDRIDSTICDEATVSSSLEKATRSVELDPHINAKEQLFKELLKRWKPRKKNMLN